MAYFQTVKISSNNHQIELRELFSYPNYKNRKKLFSYIKTTEIKKGNKNDLPKNRTKRPQ